ncbi:ABC transporter ATP-binding protein [Pseudodonghicola xiamenensis]|uniref:ABC transporter ATP-binding protein n=1 Tax=Pseudodonghicola xiamenensis TaxID=337702 RepID=A0A8J3H504_9RHOB|nr:ABC transporter ATP-binding protein [Pseudodonghicola xiamenensis]GHG86240.1 ABC transporter ATP-binding protein [Pseudodonghicola xiamenensis]
MRASPILSEVTKTAVAGQSHAVRVRDVTMDFGSGSSPAVDRASFDLEKGKFLTILGPSGSGKTTLLRMIAGFQRPTRGDITIGGKPVDAAPPHRRSVGMVFQKLALFPHMTAAENVAFPLKMRRFNPAKTPARVREFLDLVKLGDFGGRRVNELSGGQQQRVAIARALVFEPELLLLDEPLAALDRKLREEMQLEFRRIQRELGVTTINVTHDQREALVVSDDIIVMDGGIIQQHAKPVEMYRAPENLFVSSFLGVSTFIDGQVAEGGMHAADGSLLRGTPVSVGLQTGQRGRGAIRAEQIRIDQDQGGLSHCDTVLQVAIKDVIFEGERLLYTAASPILPGVDFQIYHHDPEAFDLYEVGQQVWIGWKAGDLKVFKAAD